jgi:hypothetical protein
MALTATACRSSAITRPSATPKDHPRVKAGTAKGLPRDTWQTPFSAVLVNRSLRAKLFTKHAADIVVQMQWMDLDGWAATHR